MKSALILIGTLAALLLESACATEEAEVLRCPDSPAVEESFRDVDPAWEVMRDEGKRGIHLTSISIYDGHPSGMATLVPNATNVKNKKRISRWELAPTSGAGYWFSCNYSNTQLMVARRVPNTARVCEVGETLLANGRSISVDFLRCH
ncbi:hypothetical protein DBR42_10890 [Pelomonas sp. HMWF004]|nr:hypothetical protein DBR42_10890 [Pelomonas sp. HMWF004]